MKECFGKYRGKVESNLDPQNQGRIQVSAPAVLGDGRLSWAMPCVPYAGPGVGSFAVPPVGANVWVEFEGGDLDHPIWSGCFWGLKEAPLVPAVAQVKVLQTESTSITLDDTPGSGGISIETTAGMKIKINDSGIEISNGRGASIKLQGPTVSLNGDALEIT